MQQSAESDPETFSPVRALARLGGFAAVGAAIAGTNFVFGIGLPCPLLALTGIQCPLCGSTRAAGALLTGNLAAAWHFNALLVIVIPLIAGCAVAWIVESAGGPALRPPEAWRPLTQTKVYWAAGVVCAIFVVVRNLV
ncbi:DUF2752 domain-containing protein [Brooklawnia sp.]|uniref:DUF2752 domain-containing protein n=1 Tax=Brooklawnia sp. TaxID=2699740 RepID=UPI00311F49EB